MTTAFIYLFIYIYLVRLHGILVPWSGIKPGPMAVEAPGPHHWTTREALIIAFRKEFETW